MKEAVTTVIDTLTREDFHGAFQKLLERFKYIAARRDYFEEDLSFMWVLSINVPIRRKSGNLFNDSRVYIYIYIYINGWRKVKKQIIPNLMILLWKSTLNVSVVITFIRALNSRKNVVKISDGCLMTWHEKRKPL